MLFNINLLSSCLLHNNIENSKPERFEVGDLLIAPLLVENLNCLKHLINFYNIKIYDYQDKRCIMARAEVLKIVHTEICPMVGYFF